MNENTKIKLLPDFVANQIAAGEVVQRPESAVKELIENALDSGANSIAIVIRGAGKQLIHIVDNGSGMSGADLALSCKRHATSKIVTAEDLEEIRTFGFRGEALASICSVANVEIRTRSRDEQIGWKLIAEPNKEDRIEPFNTVPGTQVFVRNLFYNVPARRKFLKSNLTEFRYISDTIIRFALSHINTRFTFYDEDNLIFDVHPSTLERRIGEVLGKSVIEGIMRLDFSNDVLSINGFIGHPHISKSSSAGQYLFLNGRSIKSKTLSHAVFSAYEHLLEKSSYPFYMLNLTLDPKVVDVNVHPQKQEVKFEDERLIYKFINLAVTSTLQENHLAPEASLKTNDSNSPFHQFNNQSMQDLVIVNKETGEIIEPKLEQHNELNRARLGEFSGFANSQSRQQYIFPTSGGNSVSSFSEKGYADLFSQGEQSATNSIMHQNAMPLEQESMPDFLFWVLHNKYIFHQTQNGLVVIDQHAAHERILYERALKAMNREFAYSQNLLFPVKLELNSSEFSLVKELSDDLTNLGFDFEISEGSVLLKGVPLDVLAGGEAQSLKDIIEQYEEDERVRQTTKRDNLAASFACKAAIKTGKTLITEEIKKLINDLFACEMPYVCPHGRPVMIEFPLYEFDKRFGRI